MKTLAQPCSGLPPLDRVDVDRHQRGLPVVRVHHVGNASRAPCRARARRATGRRSARGCRRSRRPAGRRGTGDRSSGGARGSRSARRCPAARPSRTPPRAVPRPHRHAEGALERARARASRCRRRAAAPRATSSPAARAPSAARRRRRRARRSWRTARHSEATNRIFMNGSVMLRDAGCGGWESRGQGLTTRRAGSRRRERCCPAPRAPRATPRPAYPRRARRTAG